ncbi:uncharacterized protein LOC116001359 [Ipomoea triloba]|uniref:uncharacterized protein LOC116001359 n=1 Tax=Ipomoea triloba TaxID=35885 RepID=UPI00125D62EF|nr:uncharacterized protein LOC116001359 [Ipomoea triloba]
MWDHTIAKQAKKEESAERPKLAIELEDVALEISHLEKTLFCNFLDAFRGYNKILMEKEDVENTTFIILDGVYFYKVMEFGLKNLEATFIRMVARLFGKILDKNMEANMDDLLGKSKEESEHIEDFKVSFKIMKKFNPKKYVFVVRGVKFLVYLVT